MPHPEVDTTVPGRTAPGALRPLPARGRIGPYRLIRPLGEGGMGVVYLAEQDEPVRREVAIKVLRAGMESAEIVARFESERQALALMEHPNITRVYDAGTTDDGLPYFVMERVDGVPITEYADARRLTVRERVQLFGQVCHAVQHAHQKGIIHRDLKPSNVLVTETDGEPQAKVIDFGIAKALQPTPGRENITRTGLVVGTPAYMSPEQFAADGGAVDTRSDVYALGVLLYELLVGALPYDGGSAHGWALHALHVTGEVPPPAVRLGALDAAARVRVADTRRTDQTALRRALTGELAWVLLRALEQAPGRRYQTAYDLARDLERYLGDEPVLATGGSRGYRARKFVQRHKAAVGFAGALAVALVVFSVATAVQARRLAQARTLAQARQAQAEELIRFMLVDLRGRLQGTAQLAVLDTLGGKALAYFASVPASALSDEERARQGLLFEQIGQVRLDQGRPEEALALFRRALAESERLVARHPDRPAWQIGLGHAHYWTGRVHWDAGRVDSALAHFEPFLTIGDGLVRSFPDSTGFLRERAYALGNVGAAYEARGRTEAALGAYVAWYDIERRLLARDPRDSLAQRDAGLALHALGIAQRRTGDLRGAVASHREERALMAALYARDTTQLDRRRYVGLADAFLGVARLAVGQADSATRDLREALAHYSTLVRRDSANTEWRYNQMNATRALALALFEAGQSAEARRLADAHARLGATLPTTPAMRSRLQRERVQIAALRGRLLLSADPRAAVTALRAAALTADSVLASQPTEGERRRMTAEVQLVLGDALAAVGDGGAARAAWERTAALGDTASGGAPPTDLLAARALALYALRRDAEGRALTRALLARGYARPSFVARLRRDDPALVP